MIQKDKTGASLKKPKNVSAVKSGIVHIQASFNNTIITITDQKGNALCAQTSAGSEGFKGSRKSTPFAAQVAATEVAKTVKENFKMEEVMVKVKGIGPGANSVIKAIKDYFKILIIIDKTAVPHNGPRKSKKRRV